MNNVTSRKIITGHTIIISCSIFQLLLLLALLQLSGFDGKIRDAIEFIVAIFLIPINNAVFFATARFVPSPIFLSSPFAKSAPHPGIKIQNIVGLFAVILTVFVLYFDYSLSVEPLHYLTNLAPAFHLHNGGILLHDTFSQYGPGPVVVTYLTGWIFGFSFGTANIVVQLFNLIFYVLILIVTYVVCKSKPLVLLVPLVTIGVVLSIWGMNGSNVNIAPSVLGFRYLPLLIMVLGIALLPSNRCNSFLTVFALSFASLWSFEALFGTVLIHLCFITGVNLNDRNFRKLLSEIVISIFICAITISVFIIVIKVWSGLWVDLTKYLGFISIYNPVSEYWAKSSSLNFEWYFIALVFIHLNTLIVYDIIYEKHSKNVTLYNYVLPVLYFSIFCSLYYKSRSIDYTLTIVYPALSILVSMFIVFVYSNYFINRKVVFFVIIVSLSFIPYYYISQLYRKNSNYSFLLHECRDENRCTLPELAYGLRRAIAQRPVLEPVGNQWADYRLQNENILQDAITVITKNLAKNSKPTVLLGKVQHISYLSDLALLYSGKWHSWPRSFTFTDELVFSIRNGILDFSPQNMLQNLIVVRKDKAALEIVESGIWARILSDFQLCPLKIESEKLEAYEICGLH